MIIAGDIGGTKTTLGLFSVENAGPVLQEEKTFLSRDYPAFENILSEFLKERPLYIAVASFGVAGPVIKRQSRLTNLPWILDPDLIGQKINVPRVLLVNDLEATAHGTPFLKGDDLAIIQNGEDNGGNVMAIIAPGTGLGEAIFIKERGEIQTLSSEGGHSDFAPRNSLEIRLLEYLMNRFGHVSYERILSGPGLHNIYRFLKESEKEKESPLVLEQFNRMAPEIAISGFAIRNKDLLCVKSLELFVSILGAEAGNLALKTMATGGLYLGGGIVPQILPALRDGAFIKAFLDKGRFSGLLQQIPVKVIREKNAALLGAARFGFMKYKTS